MTFWHLIFKVFTVPALIFYLSRSAMYLNMAAFKEIVLKLAPAKMSLVDLPEMGCDRLSDHCKFLVAQLSC